MLGYGPDRQFRPVGNAKLSEDPVQVLLNGTFGQMQLVGDLLILLCFTYEIHDLALAKTEGRIQRPLEFFGFAATGTNPVPSRGLKLLSASKAVSEVVKRRVLSHIAATLSSSTLSA